MSETEIVETILDLCRRLNAKNYLAAADGNVSFRISDERILFTPSGVNKAFLRAEDIAAVDLQNRVLQGSPSSERLMHLEVYRSCPKARAVVHAHPPHAIAWTVARAFLKELPAESMPEVLLAVGRIPVVPYARPSTAEMGANLRQYLPRCRVMILARHGALAWGEDLQEAYNGIERLEHSASILKLAQDMGGLSALPGTEVAALVRMRQKLGERTL